MSSLFKKKGGLAFKPKIPSSRSRPAPTAPKQQPEPSIATATDAVVDETSASASSEHQISTPADALNNEAPEATSAADADATPAVVEPPALRASSRSSRRPSTSHGDVTPVVEDNSGRKASISSQAVKEKVPAQAAPEAPAAESEPGDTPRARRLSTRISRPQVQDEAATPSIDDGAQSTENASATIETSEVPVAAPARSKTSRSKQTDAAPSTEGDGTVTGPTKRRKTKPPQNEEQVSQKRARQDEAEEEEETRQRRRKARSATPEDAEEQLVDLQQTKMADLTKDLRIGKKFSRHDELRERERLKRLKAKLSKDGESTEDALRKSETPAGTPPANVKKTDSTSSAGPAPPPAAPASGPQFRIVDGQIVVDQSSLVMDRHARAAAAQAGQDLETIEENDFTRLTTSNSYMTNSKLRGPNNWTLEETEMFYKGLRMMGTDFEMISKMIPGKQRRHVKLKFNREERHHPKLIDAALMGEKTVKMDIDEYMAATGSEFETVEAIEAEHRKAEEGFEAERKRIADEQAEIMRKKREELFAEDDAADGASGNGKKKKGNGKRGKNTVAYGLNGEPITNS